MPRPPDVELWTLADEVETLPPEVGTQLAALAAELTDAQVQRLCRITDSIWDCATTEAHEARDAEWQALLAHVPGFAAALEVLHSHVEGARPPCAPEGYGEPCRYLQEVPPTR